MKLHTVNNAFNLANSMELQARPLYCRRRFGEAESEALRAIEAFEKVGDTDYAKRWRQTFSDLGMKKPMQIT